MGPEPDAGLRRMLDAGLVAYERLPMLETTFDRLVRVLSTSLRSLSNESIEIGIDPLSSVRFGDFLAAVPSTSMLAIFKIEEWDNVGLMVLDAALNYSVVDVLLGSPRGSPSTTIEERPYTPIERSLLERMIKHILRDLSAAFQPIAPVMFRLDRLETNRRFAAICRPSNSAVLARLRVRVHERAACLEIVLPYATLEPIRDELMQQFMGERLGRDDLWEKHLANALRETDVELDAVLGELSMNLSEVLALKQGSRIVLPLTADDPVELRCGGVPLFSARTGNRRNRIAVQIESKLPSGDQQLGASTE